MGNLQKSRAWLMAALLLVIALLAACAPMPARPAQSVPGSPAVRTVTVYVGPELVDCVGVAPQKCMQWKATPEGEYRLFYGDVQGFNYVPGYEYEIKVRVEPVANPPADAPAYSYSLVDVVSSTPASAAVSAEPSSGSKPAAKAAPVAGEAQGAVPGTTLESTPWLLVTYVDNRGKTVNAPTEAPVTIEFKDGMIAGKSGCNNYTGTYQASGSELTITLGASTMMACADPVMQLEQAYLDALSKAAEYRLAGGELQIKDKKGKTFLTYTLLQPASLVMTPWDVLYYNNGKGGMTTPLNGSEISLLFGNDGQVSGNAGCNNYTAGFKVNGDQLAIGPAAATRMFCSTPEGVMDQEVAYLNALGSVSSFTIQGDALTLLDAKGTKLVEAKMASLPAATQPAPVPANAPSAVPGSTLESTPWLLVSYTDKQGKTADALPDAPVTIDFKDGMIAGKSGCNNYTGTYQTSGSKLTITTGASTMMACPDPIMRLEQAYLSDLGKSAAYRIAGGKLQITDNKGKTLLAYTVLQPAALAGTHWDVLYYNNGKDAMTTPLNGSEISMLFGKDGQVSGTTGCNSYTAQYQVSGDNLTIGLAAATRMYCGSPEGVMDQEADFIAALGNVAKYAIQGDDLTLRNAEGTKMVEAKVAQLPVAATGAVPPETLVALENLTYQSALTKSGSAPLKDGKYEEEAAPGSASKVTVSMTDNVAVGDLNGDGKDDAAVVLASGGGGSGTFIELVAVVDQSGQWYPVDSVSLGDRVKVNSLSIEHETIVVDMTTHGPNDPMCCPTENVVQTYKLQGDQLVLTGSQGASTEPAAAPGAVPPETLATLENLTYPSSLTKSGSAPLQDGLYEEEAAPGSASKVTVRMTDKVAVGDLNGDGKDDAAVVLASSGGGSGTFIELVAVVDQDGKLYPVDSVSLGDRVIVNSLSIEHQTIVVDMTTHGPSDPMCCPTENVVQTYKLQGDQLVLTGNQGASAGQATAVQLVGPVWQWLESAYGDDTRTTVLDPKQYTVQFNSDGTVEAKADCNSGTGSYKASGPSLSIEIVAMTMAMCPPESLSDKFVQELNNAASYMILEDGTLAIAQKIDSGIMKFSVAASEGKK